MAAHPNTAEGLVQWQAAYRKALKLLGIAAPTKPGDSAGAGSDADSEPLTGIGAGGTMHGAVVGESEGDLVALPSGAVTTMDVDGFKVPMKDGVPVEPPKLRYLVKWCALSYAECTWETEETLNDDQKIHEFRQRNVRAMYRRRALCQCGCVPRAASTLPVPL